MLASRVLKNKHDLIEACCILAEQENLKVTITESGKGAMMAGAGVFLGGLVAGPIGMAVGGSVMSMAVAISSQGKFKSVIEVLHDMTDDQKKRLCKAIEKTVEKIKLQDCIDIAILILTNSSVKELVLAELKTFLKNELHLKMI
ncbi:protein C19orf12 homolog [Euwallacea fornicatus]|uniref:protein C19orf12 homolog n=1 Tax=Euwallacea fornicatus TaxID=995702 RepID=UPI0033905F19